MQQVDVNLNEAAARLGLSLKELSAEMARLGIRYQRRRNPNDPLSKLKTECISQADLARLEAARGVE